MDAWTALLSWGAAQPLFLQVCLGLFLFLAAYTAASVALVGAVLVACWAARTLARRFATRNGTAPTASVSAPIASWFAHVLGATWVAWQLTRVIWP